MGIVIIGRNEGERLILCLQSVLKVHVACVYVDSQSIDDSVKEAEQRGVRAVVLDKSAPINASRARNTGFKVLVDDNPDIKYVHFIDADCELHPEWLSHAVMSLDESESVAVVCGRLHEKYKYKNTYMRLCDMDWYIKPGEIEACGGIATIRRSVLEEMKGFDETLIAGADPELYFRIRQIGDHKIVCLPIDMGTHDSNMHYFSEYWQRSVKTGYAYISKMHLGMSAKPVKSALIWSVAIPLAILLLILLASSKFILLLLVYPIQVLRIYMSLSEHPSPKYSQLLYSIFCVLGKFPESVGIVKYMYNAIKKRDQTLIEYKAK